MKAFYLSVLFASFFAPALAQDLVYLSDGKTVPGKIVDINTENLKLTAPGVEENAYGLDQVLLAVNAAGDYVVLNGSRLNDEERKTFMEAGKYKLPSNIIISRSGNIIAAETFKEEGTDLVYQTNGEAHTVALNETAAVIRQNGTHKLYVSAGQAIVPLRTAKPKISTLVSILGQRAAAKPTPAATEKAAVASKNTPAPAPAPEKVTPVSQVASPALPVAKVAAATASTAPATPAAQAAEPVPAPKINLPAAGSGSPDLQVNMEAFSKKALQKTEEFSNYLQMISGVNSGRDKALKSINQAVQLFHSEDSRVEVSSTRSQEKNKYKIRDYLNRLQFRSGQYDKIIIEYADINYASEFKKGADGNYYGVVTFVQKFRGFVDGEVVYGDITKRNLTIILKHYEKAVEGSTVDSWDVFLADVGVVETKKL